MRRKPVLLENHHHVLKLAVRVAAHEQPVRFGLGRRDMDERARGGGLLLEEAAARDEDLVDAAAWQRLGIGPPQVRVQRVRLLERVGRLQHKASPLEWHLLHDRGPVCVGVPGAGHRVSARGKSLEQQLLHLVLPLLPVNELQLIRLLEGIIRCKGVAATLRGLLVSGRGGGACAGAEDGATC
eukprot:scaffold155036_cov23-Tisochrysis_lutea.AAC.1